MIGIALTLLVYATQIVAGRLVLMALGRGEQGAWSAGPGAWARVLLLGPGAIAVQMLAYGFVGLPFALWSLLAPWWIGAVVVWRAAPNRREVTAATSPGQRLAVGLALLFPVLAFAAHAVAPIHTGDEMHNFALSAKFFATHGGLAPEALAAMVDPGHNEYPPLVALNEALLFMADPELAPWSARLFFGLATVALALLVVQATARARTPWIRNLLVVLVVAAPGYAVYAADGRPDLRLTATILLLGLCSLELGSTGPRGTLRFAIVAGLAALTKNEGIAIAAGAALFVLGRWLTGRSNAGVPLLALATIAVLTVAWPLYREAHGIRDQFASDAWSGLDPAVALQRVPHIAGRFAALTLGAPGFQAWGLLWYLGLLLGMLVLRQQGRGGPAVWITAALAGHLGLYALTFSVTPFDLDWHLGTAGARLLVHTTPWLVLLLAQAAELRDP